MEGIVLIERQSGTLFYNKSFTGRFDLRHPRQERLNLGALLFALHNFAGSSMEPTSDDDASKGTDSRADMTMFDTAEERVVFGLAPRRGLLVALFVLPTMNANVAKSLVHRVATKYDSADDKANEQRTGSLNNIARTFRDILLKALNEEIDSILASYVQLTAAALDSRRGRAPFFVLLYRSDVFHQRDARASDCWDVEDVVGDANHPRVHASIGHLQHAMSWGKFTPSFMQGTLTPHQTFSKSTPSAYANAGANVSLSTKRKQSLTWASNSVVDHRPERVFERLMLTHGACVDASQAHAMLDVLRPIVLHMLPLFSHGSTIRAQQQRFEIKHVTWKHFPPGLWPKVDPTAAPPTAPPPLSLWMRGNTLVVSPVDDDLSTHSRAQVQALLNDIEPLLHARLATQI